MLLAWLNQSCCLEKVKQQFQLGRRAKHRKVNLKNNDPFSWFWLAGRQTHEYHKEKQADKDERNQSTVHRGAVQAHWVVRIGRNRDGYSANISAKAAQQPAKF